MNQTIQHLAKAIKALESHTANHKAKCACHACDAARAATLALWHVQQYAKDNAVQAILRFVRRK